MKLSITILAAAFAAGTYADPFSCGAAEFTLTFRNLSSGSNPSGGYGIVGYDYGIGTYEVTAEQWQKYVNVSGGGYNSSEVALRSSFRTGINPYIEGFDLGCRIAVIPDPSSVAMIGLGSGCAVFVGRWFGES